MSEVYRTIRREDYQAIKNLIRDTWNIDRFIQSAPTLDGVLTVHLRECLVESTFGRVVVVDGSVEGVILGSIPGQRKAYSRVVHIPYLLFGAVKLVFASRADRRNIAAHLSVFRTYKEMLADRKSDFQGSVTLLAVSKKCRGQGIGKNLLASLHRYFLANSVSSIYVFTDTWCNYCFYDSQGYSLKDSRSIRLRLSKGEVPLTIFLYARDLSE